MLTQIVRYQLLGSYLLLNKMLYSEKLNHTPYFIILKNKNRFEQVN